MSAHADATQIMDWLKTIKKPPQQVFITHGEAAAADALRWRIEHELGWPATVPLMGQHALIDAF
jgi:metallo-beta-lactamase family protein